MHIKPTLLTILAAILVLSLSACLMPTRVAAFPTATKAATEVPATLTPSPVPSSTPTAAATPSPQPTSTATPQPSPSAALEEPAATTAVVPTETPQATETPTPTSTPSVPMISARMNTNCRKGPDPVYQIVGSLEVGERAEVVGRSIPGGWWYIKNPSLPGGYCWVWGYTTEVTGDTASLRIVLPPASPTPTR